MFPNLYTVLVGKPASGKSRAILECRAVAAGIPDITMTPAKITKEKLVLKMAASTKLIQTSRGAVSATVCGAFITELGTFFTGADPDFLNNLTDLFDCPTIWVAETVKRGEDRIENLFLAMLGGTTPRGISPIIAGPMQGTGFVSRLNIICSNETKPPSLYAEPVGDEHLAPFVEAVGEIAKLEGPFAMDESCRREMQTWFDAGLPPRVTSPRFEEYNGRRHGHLLKLCMIYNAARGGGMTITLDDYAKAKDTLLEAEAAMNIALQYAGTAATAEVIIGIEHWMREELDRSGNAAIPEVRLKRRLLEDISPQHMAITITEMLQSGVLRAVYKGAVREFTLG